MRQSSLERRSAAPVDDLDAVRAGHWWQAFTGLVPVVLMVPILLARAYTAGALVAALGAVLVIGYHLWRGQGLTSLDVLAFGFATVNLVLYVGFDNTVLIENLDAVFYTLLAVQSGSSLLHGRPWTTQFTRRTVVPELWDTAAFREMNVLTTRLWFGCFVACDVVALAAPGPTSAWVPLVLMLATVALSRRLGGRHLRQRLAAPA